MRRITPRTAQSGTATGGRRVPGPRLAPGVLTRPLAPHQRPMTPGIPGATASLRGSLLGGGVVGPPSRCRRASGRPWRPPGKGGRPSPSPTISGWRCYPARTLSTCSRAPRHRGAVEQQHLIRPCWRCPLVLWLALPGATRWELPQGARQGASWCNCPSHRGTAASGSCSWPPTCWWRRGRSRRWLPCGRQQPSGQASQRQLP
jgi:hypothetical protein